MAERRKHKKRIQVTSLSAGNDCPCGCRGAGGAERLVWGPLTRGRAFVESNILVGGGAFTGCR